MWFIYIACSTEKLSNCQVVSVVWPALKPANPEGFVPVYVSVSVAMPLIHIVTTALVPFVSHFALTPTVSPGVTVVDGPWAALAPLSTRLRRAPSSCEAEVCVTRTPRAVVPELPTADRAQSMTIRAVVEDKVVSFSVILILARASAKPVATAAVE